MRSLWARLLSVLAARPWLVVVAAGLISVPTIALGEIAAADTRTRLRDAQLQAQSAAAVRAATRASYILGDVADHLAAAVRPNGGLVAAVSTGDRKALQSALAEIATLFTYARAYFYVDRRGVIIAGTTTGASTGPSARVIGRRADILPWLDTPRSRIGSQFMTADEFARTFARPEMYFADFSVPLDRAGEPMTVDTATGAWRPGEERYGYRSAMALPVMDQRGTTLLGALVAEIVVAPLGDAVFELQGIADAAYLVDRNGRLIRKMLRIDFDPWDGVDLSAAEAVQAVRDGRILNGEGIDPLIGGHALLASARVPDVPADSGNHDLLIGWTVIAAQPLAHLYADVDAGAGTLRAIRIALVVGIMLLAGLLTFAVRRVVRQRGELATVNESLELAGREIEAAARHKSEFLANMSHELRTPLNAIIGFSDVLRERMFGELNTKQAEYIGDISSSGNHLLALVNEVLDLSKVEAGRMELERGNFSLAEAVTAAMTLVRERATRHDIRLAAIMPADLGSVDGDERKIRQVLLNLLSNAVKFTPDGGSVEVTVRRADDELLVSVHDTGVGIAAEDQPRVFEEFQQVGSASGRSEGTGLGLTLAKRFIELHGGRIWLESAVGRGTTFTFAIPAHAAPMPAHA